MVIPIPEPSPRRRLAPLVVNWALITFAMILVALAMWIRFRFGDVSFEQIISNLPISNGTGIGNNHLALEAALWCVAAPVLLVAATAVAVSRAKLRWGAHRLARRTPLVSVTVALAVFLNVTGVPQFAIAQLSEHSIAVYYAEPSITTVPTKPLNLITIYLESTENTFADADLMGENLLANLDDATADWSNYPGLAQYEGGGWTMAGLVGTHCGIPLKSRLTTQGLDYNKMGEEVDHYLPGVTCLGDVLAEQGYSSTFVGGADDDFAGKQTFLKDHGYSQVLGLSDWKAAGEDVADFSAEWGLSDARTLAHAQELLVKLHRKDQPFNLTILTLDTHEPAGVFPGCNTNDDVAMATAIKCSTKAVGRFLSEAKSAGYLDDTVVMVMGDHLKGTGENDSFRSQLISEDHRTIVLRVWSPHQVEFARESADQLSIMATTLELLGFGLDEGRGGIGVSFAQPHDLTNTALDLDADQYKSLLRAPSTEIYQQFWQ